MPLIIISGVPASGKTSRALALKAFFEKENKEVHLISEIEQVDKANFEKNQFYLDSTKEKHIRGVLKSEAIKLITPHNVVILDALNYIKGYRYELYCAAKANNNTQCTIHTQINQNKAWEFNGDRPHPQQYTREVFDALLMRYEEPNGKNRWDSPLFVINPYDQPDLPAIFSVLFDKAPPPPNMSTQNAPLSSTNFLYDLDQVTKKIVDGLVRTKNMGVGGLSSVKVDDFPHLEVDISTASSQQLMNLRRQYISYSKMHPPDTKNIPQLFVQYLNTSLNNRH